MKIIRGRLTAADVSNPSIRYNPDTDAVEFTPDGGATWTPAPSLDIRHSTLFLKPPVAGSSKQCDAAANMTKWFKDFIDAMLFDFVLVGSVTTIINSILLSLSVVTEGFTTFLALISEAAETISTIGGTALEAAFTSDQYDLLQCIFFCRADSDGQISAANLALIESDITTQLNTTAALITNFILSIQGEIGLSNAGAIGSETGDCTACGCAWCYNTHDGARLDEWVAEDFTGGNFPTYSGGQWNSVLIGITACLWISWTFSSTTNLTDAAITAEDSSGLNRQIYINGDGTAFSGTLVWNNGTLVGGALPADADRIDVIMVQAFNSTPRFISAMQYSGFGDPPFGDSNC